MNTAASHRRDFEEFTLQKFPPDSKRGTSGVYHRDFGDRVRAAIKDPSCADKSLRFFVKKTRLQLLDLPSLGARDVLVVPAKEQVCQLQNGSGFKSGRNVLTGFKSGRSVSKRVDRF